MKHLIFCCFILFFGVKLAVGQEKAVAKITYQFKHLRDTVNHYLHSEEMVLLFGKNSSVYSSQTKHIQDSTRAKAYADAESNGGIVNLGIMRPTTQESLFVSVSEKKLIIEAPFQRNVYIISDPLEEIKWKILPETKKIKGFICQKAITTFKGRTYDAWFTADLPLGFGPWKLHGLPGVILEAADNKNEVQFVCTTVIRNPNQFILIPTKGIRSTKIDFNKMMAAYMDGAGRGSGAGSNSDVSVEGIKLSGSSSSGGRKGSGINNPIEKGN